MPGHSYKGTAAPFRSSRLDGAPVATRVAAGRIGWTWTLENPDNWGIFLTSNVTIGAQVASVTGTTRVRPGLTAGTAYTVVGLNSTLTSFQTQLSNSVVV